MGLGAAALLTTAAGAQVRPQSESLAPSVVAESLAVLRTLDDSLRRRAHRADPDLWFRRGMLAWSLSVRGAEPPPITGVTWQRYGHMADTSLRIAARLAPDRVELGVAAGRYVASVPGVFNRAVAMREFEASLRVAEARGEPGEIALTLQSIGRVQWRLYQPYHFEMRRGVRDVGVAARRGITVRADAAFPEREAGPATDPDASFHGEFYLLAAERALARAHALQPGSAEIARDLAALLSLGGRWDELAELGRKLLAHDPQSAWGPSILGLAAQRRGSGDAGRWLTQGLRALPDSLQRLLDDPARLMTAAESTLFVALPPAQREERTRWFWLLTDPLWTVPDDDPRTEFLARLVQADLRYGVPDMAIRGTETGRGALLLRWGPPVFDRNIRYRGAQLNTVSFAGGGGAEFIGIDRFHLMGSVDELIRTRPVTWANAQTHLVEDIAAQVARFRAGDTLTDVLLATRIPLERLDAVAHLRGATTAHHWLIKDARDTAWYDSVRVDSGDGYVARPLRVGPGTYAARVEALRDGATLAARAQGIVVTSDDPTVGFRSTGFGVSDVLLTEAPARETAARRWHDVAERVLVGAHDRAQPLQLAWEIYDAPGTGTDATLQVRVRVERTDAPAAGVLRSIVARIIGGGSARGDDVVEVEYTAPRITGPVHLERFMLDLSQSEPGMYRVSVDVTDAAGRIRRSAPAPLHLQ